MFRFFERMMLPERRKAALVKLAVIGDPVAHSRSPHLHRGFLREAEIDGSYVAIQVPRTTASPWCDACDWTNIPAAT